MDLTVELTNTTKKFVTMSDALIDEVLAGRPELTDAMAGIIMFNGLGSGLAALTDLLEIAREADPVFASVVELAILTLVTEMRQGLISQRDAFAAFSENDGIAKLLAEIANLPETPEHPADDTL